MVVRKKIYTNSNNYLYPIYEYKNEECKKEFFDFEIVNNEATITKVKKLLPNNTIYLPKTIKIDSKIFNVTSLASGSLEDFGYIDEFNFRFKCSIYGNSNITSLNDNFISKAIVYLYNFPNIKYVGSGDYFIYHFIMNNNLASIHYYNLFSDYPYNNFYIGDKCRIIDVTDEELELMNNYKTQLEYFESYKFF